MTKLRSTCTLRQALWLQYDEGSEPAESGIRGASRVWSYSSKLKAAFVAEFLGMMIFQIYGGNAPDSVAAFGNGITLVVLGMRCPIC